MTQEQFENLVKNTEEFARKYPRKYLFYLKLLANMGYAYIIALIILPLVFAGVLIWLGFFFPLSISAGIINVVFICLGILLPSISLTVFKSLKVYFQKPKGLKLIHKDAPALFYLIDNLTSNLKAPKFDHIILTGEFNAGVVQIPSSLILHHNYLILGLPLMCALSLEEFQSILAHELGHLSRNHSQLQGQIYLVRQTWYQVWENLKKYSESSTFMINTFINWYAPFLYGYSFYLSRMNEYEADHCAVEITGSENLAKALINIHIIDRHLEMSFWQPLYKQSYHQNSTPNKVYTELYSTLEKGCLLEEKAKLFDLELDQRTNYEDTHPCLSERLAFLGYNPLCEGQLKISEYRTINAAQKLLGNYLENCITYLNREWQQKMSFQWNIWYEQYQELQMSLKHLENQSHNQKLEISKQWNLACLTKNFVGDKAAIPQLQGVLEIDPKHSDANYMLGNIFLELGDVQGIDYIETAFKYDYRKIASGCELIRVFMRQQGNFELADQYRERGDHNYRLSLLAEEERLIIDAKDTFKPHHLPNNIIKILSRKLSDYPQMKEAYLVQKALKYFPEQPLYILGVVRKGFLGEEYSDELDQELINELYLDLNFSESLNIIPLIPLNFWSSNLKRVLSCVPNSKIIFD
ncbi:M48 family metallopeptidase [Anabaena catenula]|nr:M48 family metallopeptidase [Anabaena catenula]